MYVCNSEIVQKANRIVAQCGTRDPKRIARELGIEVMYLPFSKQRGAYKVIMRNRFMFIKDNLHPVMENIVLLHELGHDTLHREEATRTGGFEEFNILNSLCGFIFAFISNSSLFLSGILPGDLTVWFVLPALPHGKESFCHCPSVRRTKKRQMQSYHSITTVLLTKHR